MILRVKIYCNVVNYVEFFYSDRQRQNRAQDHPFFIKHGNVKFSLRAPWKILLFYFTYFIIIILLFYYILSCGHFILYVIYYIPRCEFRSAARVGPSGHGWPYSGDQGLMTIVGPTVVFSVLPTLAANTDNQRCARPSAQEWSRLEPTVWPTLANCFRWPWQFSQPISGPWLNQSLAY